MRRWSLLMSNFRCLVLLFFLSFDCTAYFFDYLKFQHAGEIGEIALGVGKKFTPFYSLDFLHGLVRSSVGGKRIETLALKNNFELRRFQFKNFASSLYAGISFFHVTGVHYRSSNLNAYPSDYYRLGSIRGLMYGGIKIKHLDKKHHQLFVESGINDVWVTNYYNNPKEINPFDYFSMAAGYTYLFE